MSACYTKAWLSSAVLFALIFFSTNSYAQLTIGAVDAGPYTPGSSITAPFTINGASCIRTDNTFELYLSDASGNFGAETLIGTHTGFYSTFVNGVIPTGTPAGTNYKLRVKSTSPVLISTESSFFEIKAGAEVTAKLISNAPFQNTDEAFGFCSSRAGPTADINLVNQSTDPAVVTATITNELTGGTPTTIVFNNPQETFNPGRAHYSVFVKAVSPDGTVATKTYFIINNNVNTNFTTSNSAYVCIPGGFLQYFIDVSSPTGIQNNFPGNTYVIDWGDQTSNNYTFCDLKSGTVLHSYTLSSCGQVYKSGNLDIPNVFGVNIQAMNSFCGPVGTQISTIAKVVQITENRFTSPPFGCTTENITFSNVSVLGQNPNSNDPSCQDATVRFNWYINGVLALSNVPISTPLIHKFTNPGSYAIRLESVSQTDCQGPPYVLNICIQRPPVPSFTLPATLACGPANITPVNTSTIDNTCNPTVTYNWVVSPATGFSYRNGTSAASAAPDFTFTTPGKYTISLDVTTLTCGLVSSATQTLTVNNLRVPTLSPDTKLCNITSVYNFSASSNGPTKTTYTGTEVVLDDVYEWTITGTGTFSFQNGTTAASKYPAIKFNNYAVYTITVKTTNICGSSTKTQQIEFLPAPIVNAGTYTPICYNAAVPLNASITGSVTSAAWVGGGGTFSPNRNALNAIYTPTNAEVNAGQVVLTLRATTNLGNPCNTIDDEVIIGIRPKNNITSAAAESICSAANVNYQPTSGVNPSVYNWTATNPDGRATGFSAMGNGLISDVITNTSNSVATKVIYTITATANSCIGPEFTFTVTVDPKPAITATPANAIICSNNGAAIALSSTAAGTSYTWTSVATAGITGNTNRTIPATVTSINELLVNNSTTQGTVTYTITPITSGGCPGDPVMAVVKVDPKVTVANAGGDDNLCGATSYVMQGNTPLVGSGVWTLTSGQTGVTYSDASAPNATVSGLVNGQIYIFSWTITGTGTCGPTTDNVRIAVNTPTAGGTTAGSANVCSGSNSGSIVLSGQIGNILRWERSVNNGANWTQISNTTTTQAYSSLTTTTQYRAVVQNANCNVEFSVVATVTVNGSGTAALAGNPQILCAATTTTLDANTPAAGETGLWTPVGLPAGTITDPSNPKSTVTGLVPGANYTFKWTITSGSPCGPTSSNVLITNLAPITNSINTTSTEVCTDRVITIIGSTPTGGNGIYSYLWENSTDGVNWNIINTQTSKDLNYTLPATFRFRRTVFSSTCSLVSNVITIIAQPPLTNNTISATQNVCAGQTPVPLTGSVPGGADGTYFYQWQSSPNGTVWSNVNGETAQNFAPPVLAATTFYRRVVSSAMCTGPLESISAPVKLTLLNNARAEYTFNTDAKCVPFVINASNIAAVPYPDRNSSYTWFANNAPIGTGLTFPGYTITNSGETVTIKLVATSSLGCTQDEFSHDFSTTPGFTTDYTQDQTTGCGPLTVRFTNTSTSLTGVTFKWDFGNGATSSLANPPDVIFLPDPSGDDITYTITLTTTTSCGDQVKTSTVLVKSPPVGAFSPDKTTGCSPLAVTFTNTSRGDNVTFTYDFGDGSTPVTTTSQANLMHMYTVTAVTDFTVTMTATNSCGTDVNTYIIRVSPNTILPELVVPGNQKTGCAPFTVSFTNNTRGANAFVYDFKDGSTIQTSTAPETIQHTFTKGGTYVVTLYATNGCSQASTSETIVVLDQPAVAFTADKTSGCPGVSVKFKNNSVDGISYLWDFGDGSTSTEFEPEHVFVDAGRDYTVKLTATNSLGCPATLTLPNFIKVVPLPEALFSILPGNQTTIPNYRFTFSDISIGSPVSWLWDFGDGATSTFQNPTHLYTKTGSYIVRLTIQNKEGCSATSFQSVQIIDVPGALNVPNSFIPGSQNNAVRLFKAKGRGIESYRMSIFNKWGQVLWETTLLENGAPAEGWDGTYKNQPQPQGTYFWKIEVKFINGSEWKGVTYNSAAPKKTGEIYLIR